MRKLKHGQVMPHDSDILLTGSNCRVIKHIKKWSWEKFTGKRDKKIDNFGSY